LGNETQFLIPGFLISRFYCKSVKPYEIGDEFVEDGVSMVGEEGVTDVFMMSRKSVTDIPDVRADGILYKK